MNRDSARSRRSLGVGLTRRSVRWFDPNPDSNAAERNWHSQRSQAREGLRKQPRKRRGWWAVPAGQTPAIPSDHGFTVVSG